MTFTCSDILDNRSWINADCRLWYNDAQIEQLVIRYFSALVICTLLWWITSCLVGPLLLGSVVTGRSAMFVTLIFKSWQLCSTLSARLSSNDVAIRKGRNILQRLQISHFKIQVVKCAQARADTVINSLWLCCC